MAGSKRMSTEEKRQVLLSIYHKTKEVYIEKEILKLGSEAGINANTVIDINISLVDDGLVDKDKIGGSNYYWSFPGKKDRLLQLEYENIIGRTDDIKGKSIEAETRLADAKRGREQEGDERVKKLARLTELTKERASVEEELETLKQNDPQVLEDLEKELKLVTDAANRWTDNIFTCKSYLTKKRGMCSKEAFKMLGVTSDFDYPEEK